MTNPPPRFAIFYLHTSGSRAPFDFPVMIEHLKSLPKLTEIHLYNTGVTGNIEHLKLLPNLTGIYLVSTAVTGTAWW